jgi:flagellar protein FlaJ
MKPIPFVPFPMERAIKISRIFLWASSRLVKLNPFLSNQLFQAGMEVNDREYLSVAIFSSLFWFILIFSLFTSVGVLLGENFVYLALAFSFLLSGVSFFYIIFYPNLIIAKKNREVERNLLFAIRHLFIQVKSGVSLFDAMISISKGNYGVVSEEFDRCTKEIATGKGETDALEELAFRNPNPIFKRVVWQLVNSMRAGGNIGNTLNMMAQNLSEEQRVKIRKYGSQLNPLALMYLMFSVILPTLGISFLIIFSSVSGFQLPRTVFYLISTVLLVFQFSFIGIVKNRRPSVEI